MQIFLKMLPQVIYHGGKLIIKWPSLGDIMGGITIILAVVGLIALIVWWIIHHFGQK